MESKTVRNGVSLFNSGLFLMAVTHTLIHVFSRIHTALFPVFRVEFGLTLQQLGLIAAVPPLCSAILSIPSGFLSDKLGSRTILIACFLISGSAAIAVSQSANTIMLTASISAAILTSTPYHTASFSYVTKLFSEKDRSKALGVLNAGGTLGMSLGPLSLTLLVGTLGWKWRSLYLFWAFPIIAIIIAIWKIKFVQNSESEKEEASGEKKAEKTQELQMNDPESLLSVGLIMLLISNAIRMFGNGILGSFIPTYLHDVKGLTVSQASLIFGSVSLTGILAAPLGGYLADRFGNKRWLMFAVAAGATSLLAASLMPNILLFVLSYYLSRFFGSSGMAPNQSIAAKFSPRGQRGRGFALLFLPGSLIGSFAPIVGATIAEPFGLSFLFPISVAITFVSLIVLKFGVKV